MSQIIFDLADGRLVLKLRTLNPAISIFCLGVLTDECSVKISPSLLINVLFSKDVSRADAELYLKGFKAPNFSICCVVLF